MSQECLISSLTVQGGLIPVYAASEFGYTDVVDALVKAGADINRAMTKVCYWCSKYPAI